MQIPRQLRAGGGIMTLEEPRQGYFVGKLVKKAGRALKKVVKSPLGKIGLLAAGANFAPLLFGKGTLMSQAGGLGGLLTKLKSGQGFLGGVGNMFRVGGDPTKGFSVGRMLAGGLGATAIAGAILIFMGKPIDQLLILASGVAGGLGMMLKD